MINYWAFLVGDEVYEIDLPDGFSFKEVSTTLTLRPGEPGAWRHVVFVPRDELRPSASGGYRPIGPLLAGRDVPATVYEEPTAPGARVVEWKLNKGAIVTAFNPGHDDELDRFLIEMRVIDGERPRLRVPAGFSGGDLREEIQRDIVLFKRDEATELEQVLSVTKLPPRRRAEGPPIMPRQWYAQTATTDDGLMLSWYAPRAERAAVDAALEPVRASVQLRS